MRRRDFLKLVGLGSAASLSGGSLLLAPGNAHADGDFNYGLIPANKNLDPDWVASLFARGAPSVYSGGNLDQIGMPVGGICCGQIYLTGDGRLACWDIFNTPNPALIDGGTHYQYPLPMDFPVKQGLAIKVTGAGLSPQYRGLDKTGFAEVSFLGQYPIGMVSYSDPACPVRAQLEAYSPFIPLNPDDSGLPATILEVTLKNTSGASVDVELAGWLQNAVCHFSPSALGFALNRCVSAAGATRIDSSAEADPALTPMVYEDFEHADYGSWTKTGTAFGSGPCRVCDIPSYQGNVNAHGQYTVNSHASAPGADVTTKDAATGTLTSPTFTLQHDFIDFLIGGGNHPGQTCFNLRKNDGTLLFSATGADRNAMTNQRWNVSAYKGQMVYFQIVDNWTGGWGNIGVDYIRFSDAATSPRPDIVVADFEAADYASLSPKWTPTGTAFGAGPIRAADMPPYQNPSTIGQHGERLVNSHASAPGSDVGTKDAAIGTLTSDPFVISRKFLSFLIGGGNHPGQTCLNLLVNSQVVRTATGSDNNQLGQSFWNVSDLEGQTAVLQIVDNWTGGWGNIGVDYVVLTDTPTANLTQPEDCPDFGTMSLALLDPRPGDRAHTGADLTSLQGLFDSLALNVTADTVISLPAELIGTLSRSITLAAGQTQIVRFALAWHFPKTTYNNASLNATWGALQGSACLKRHYAARFADVAAVLSYVAANFASLSARTRLWRDTWYDSTLPYWFLDRTFANTSILATNTCHRFDNGRFWGWEGGYCCAGTCIHVWHYAQAVARIFPQLERDTRQRVDLGISFDAATGQVASRAENGAGLAVDGQASIVLRSYREHQMSPDGSFLTTNWPRIKLAMRYLMDNRDKSGSTYDGILEGSQPNTLDADWYGKIAWLSGLYVAACKACEQMALEMGDTAFASQLSSVAAAGAAYIRDQLFYHNEYFVQLPESSGNNVGAGWGCEIDQVFGQSWAWQVGLGRVLDRDRTLSALGRLWKYNYAPDAGGFRTNPANPVGGGRVYAIPGEAGLVMCTFPDPAHQGPLGLGWTNGYFNECMTGFEHQVASHMLWEGLVQEGLAITRSIHDRYHPSKRNPWNEVECGDHYARAMASFGTFLAVCGYEYHGPRGYLAFSPRLTPDNFRAAFTAAEGWGTLDQVRTLTRQTHTLNVKLGQLRLNQLAFDLATGAQTGGLSVRLNGSPVAATMSRNGDRVVVQFATTQTVPEGQSLVVEVRCMVDSDGDGMPDAWEDANGLDRNSPADRDLDPDHDGQSNYAEFIAGTDPQSAASVFKLASVRTTPAGVEVTWTSVPGRLYTIEYAESLSSPWQTLQASLPAASGTTTAYLDSTAPGSTSRYYRVVVLPP